MNGLPIDRSRQRDRPVQPDRPWRHAEPPADLHLSTRRREAVRQRRRAHARDDDPDDAGAPRLPAAGDRATTSTPLMALYEAGREEGHVRRRHRAGAAADPGEPEVPVPRRDAARAAGRRARQRPRAGLAPVVLPVELDPRRRAAEGCRAGHASSQPAVLEQQVERMLDDPKSRALVDNFAGQWLLLRNLQSHMPDAGRLPELRQRAAPGVPAPRPSCSSRASSARTAACSICSNADYTFVNERLARHYGIPNVYGSHFRRVTLTERRAPRPARPGQHPDGDVLPEPHLAGAARQVDPREHPRHAAAAAAAGRARH